MQAKTARGRRVIPPGRGGIFLLAGILILSLSCSDDSLGDLGGRSSGWIGEVATTASSSTTVPPVITHSVLEADWINDEYGAPASELQEEGVLAAVFARAGDSSQYLQASREEIVAMIPEVEFPSIVPVEVTHITSQLVIESRELMLSDDPTVAFGLWAVEPYTRSRSVGQLAVLSASRDPEGVELAATGDTEAVCASLVTGDGVCAGETIAAGDVWRLENRGSVVHVWHSDPLRYQLEGLQGSGEELVHELIGSVEPLTELLPAD